MRPAMKPAVGFQRPFFFWSAKEFGGFFFGRAADFADHDDAVGFVVIKEHFKNVDVLGAFDGIAADANGRGLAKAQSRWFA